MNWYKDSILCLNEAEEIIQQIARLEEDSIHNNDLLEKCKPKIKNCLENCRSPLDFLAAYLFDTYCKESYTSVELRKRTRFNYPITYKKNKLHDGLKYNFKNLNTTRHDLVKEMEKTQPFKYNDQWLGHLKDLVNENKHARLTFSKADKIVQINNLEMPGITMRNVTMINVGVPIGIGEKDYDLINNFPPGSKNKDVSSSNKIIFEESNEPALEALKKIHRHVLETIESFNNLL